MLKNFISCLKKISLDFLKTAIEYGVALFNFLKISNRGSKKPKKLSSGKAANNC
jgi:hypothetical protein